VRTTSSALAPLRQHGLVGLRAPHHAFTSALLADLDFPVVLSSANAHGRPPATNVAEALASLGTEAEQLDLIVDAGATASAQAQRASSVLIVEPGRFELLREGLVSLSNLRRSAGLGIAFVCTGNTCRSPMAEALARQLLGRLLESDPARFGFRFESMGLAANGGEAPSPHAVEVMAARRLDIRAHRSAQAGAEALLAIDRIYTMTEAHRETLLAGMADLEAQLGDIELPVVELLDPEGYNISDPFGGALKDYELAARNIERALAERVHEWV